MDRFEIRSEKDFIRLYEKKGYTASYRHKDGKLVDIATKIVLGPEDISVVAHHRFEGLSNPSDMSILYVIESKKDSKGTILVPYGGASDNTLTAIFHKIPKDNISNNENIL